MKLALTLLAFAPLPFLLGATPEKEPFAPLDYFEANCARCHGSYGAFYGEGFAKDKSDEQLRQIVKDMAEGPGNAPLDEKSLDILTTYHISLRDKKPFLVLVDRKDDNDFVVLSGEVTPDSRLSFRGEKSVAVSLDGHQWKLRVSAKTDWKKACLVAERDGAKMVLRFAP